MRITSTARFAAAPTQAHMSEQPYLSFRRQRGYTLIEAMITVAIVAIIAAIALPSYTDYVTRSKIVEAVTGLTDMRVRLEQYFLDLRQYPTSCVAAGSGAAPAGQIYLPASTKYFTLTCTLSSTIYTVTATGKSSQGMGGFTYTIDQANARRTASLPAGWSGAGSGSRCWSTKSNGDC